MREAIPSKIVSAFQMIGTLLRAIDASDFDDRLRQVEENQAASREDRTALHHNWAAWFDASFCRD